MAVTNRDIYNNSLALIGESLSGEYVDDYEERAPYLIASVAYQTLTLDKKIRTVDGLDAAESFSPVYLSLDLDFPLCERLAFPAALYVASLLVIDEDPDLSDTLYDKYCDSVSSLDAAYTVSADSSGSTSTDTSAPDTGTEDSETVTATCESIVERYFYD